MNSTTWTWILKKRKNQKKCKLNILLAMNYFINALFFSDDLRQKLSKKDKKKEKQTAKENNKKQAAPEPKQNAEEDSESDDEE